LSFDYLLHRITQRSTACPDNSGELQRGEGVDVLISWFVDYEISPYTKYNVLQLGVVADLYHKCSCETDSSNMAITFQSSPPHTKMPNRCNRLASWLFLFSMVWWKKLCRCSL